MIVTCKNKERAEEWWAENEQQELTLECLVGGPDDGEEFGLHVLIEIIFRDEDNDTLAKMKHLYLEDLQCKLQTLIEFTQILNRK